MSIFKPISMDIDQSFQNSKTSLKYQKTHQNQGPTKSLAKILENQSSNKNLFHIKLTKIYNLQVKPQITQDSIIVRSILVYHNGSPFHIPSQYVSFIQKSMNCGKKNNYYHYSRTQNILKIKYVSKIKIGKKFPDQNINEILLNLGQISKQIIQSLTVLGIKQTFNKRSLFIKIQRLKITYKLVQLLKRKESYQIDKFENVQSMPQSSLTNIFKVCQSMSQIPDPPEFQNINHTSLTSKYNPFKITKKTYRIKLNQNNQQIDKELAVKQVNQSIINKQKHEIKLKKQIQILHLMTKPKHFVSCWQESSTKNEKLYMDYLDDSLFDLIYYRLNSLEDVLDFGKQLVQGVIQIHKQNVVHRDLKPQNVLIKKQSKNKYLLKIIDFGESALLSKKGLQNKKIMGYTLPYSPLQCAYSGDQGIYSKSIDYWSVGLIIYEMAFRTNPVGYYQPFHQNILKGWIMKDQFGLLGYIKKQSGIRYIQFILNLLIINSVCINSKQRINLSCLQQVLELCSNFISNMKFNQFY